MKAWGIFDLEFWPSVWEVDKAKEVFTQELGKNLKYIDLPKENPLHMSKDVVLSCALAAVWSAGRKYQSEKEMKQCQKLRVTE